MSRPIQDKFSTNRIIDANINRAKEGLRVCEEISRFSLNSRQLTEDFKTLRHRIGILQAENFSRTELLKDRQSSFDVGRRIYGGELKRKDYADIFFANIQRVKESLRVLEEFSKLKNIKLAVEFKKLRYRSYEIERKITKAFPGLCDYRS